MALVCGVSLLVCHFPIGILGQVWYLIASIPDLCTLTYFCAEWIIFTPGRRQSKTLLTIDERGSKIARSSVFDCHLSPVRRQMAIENTASNDF